MSTYVIRGMSKEAVKQFREQAKRLNMKDAAYFDFLVGFMEECNLQIQRLMEEYIRSEKK